MILPRGAFHSIKKGVLLSKLLHELEISHFSGLIMGSAGEINWGVVFENGACILAEFGDLQGTKAWHEIQSRDAMGVDAARSVFTGDQIRLSIEFNEQAVVQPSGEPVIRNEGEELSLPRPGELMQGAIATPQGAATRSEAGDLPGMSDKKYPEAESQVPPRVNNGILPDGRELDPEELARRDLDSLDAKEIETMARRIRMNLKETMERLSLGYLMEERQQ